MEFRLKQRVMVTHANHEQKAGWVVGKMDDCIGQPATIRTINSRTSCYLLVMDNKVELKQSSDYWFEEDLLEALDEEDAEDEDNDEDNDEEENDDYDDQHDRWFIGLVSGNVFKLLKVHGGVYYCVDKFGDEVSTKYMKLQEEPNCTGFGWSP